MYEDVLVESATFIVRCTPSNNFGMDWPRNEVSFIIRFGKPSWILSADKIFLSDQENHFLVGFWNHIFLDVGFYVFSDIRYLGGSENIKANSYSDFCGK